LGFWSDLHGVLIRFVRRVSGVLLDGLGGPNQRQASKRLHFPQKGGFHGLEHA